MRHLTYIDDSIIHKRVQFLKFLIILKLNINLNLQFFLFILKSLFTILKVYKTGTSSSTDPH